MLSGFAFRQPFGFHGLWGIAEAFLAQFPTGKSVRDTARILPDEALKGAAVPSTAEGTGTLGRWPGYSKLTVDVPLSAELPVADGGFVLSPEWFRPVETVVLSPDQLLAGKPTLRPGPIASPAVEIGRAAALATTTDPLVAIDWGTALSTTVVDVYFAPPGAYIDGVTELGPALGFTAFQMTQIMLALQSFADVTQLTFRQTTTQAGAEFRLGSFQLDPFGAIAFMVPPGEAGAGFMGIDIDFLNSYDIDSGNPLILQGGFMHAVVLEEIGHGLGLAHPHDEGGSSAILEGVTEPWGSYGIGDLNQGIFTIMGYNEGWPAGPEGAEYYDGEYIYVNDFGYETGPGALDIAVLQSKYGANPSHGAGDTVYDLPDQNTAGTQFLCVWDTGGVDEFRFDGPQDVVIDLRPATLAGEVGGGGYPSWAEGIRGGFTIAHGVMIEKATGGPGNDTLVGNAAENVLAGGNGSDVLLGGAGGDLLIGDLEAADSFSYWDFDFG